MTTRAWEVWSAGDAWSEGPLFIEAFSDKGQARARMKRLRKHHPGVKYVLKHTKRMPTHRLFDKRRDPGHTRHASSHRGRVHSARDAKGPKMESGYADTITTYGERNRREWTTVMVSDRVRARAKFLGWRMVEGQRRPVWKDGERLYAQTHVSRDARRARRSRR